jgi:hypothetical protein
MEYFPAICVDDFYEDPDYVREFALAQKFHKNHNGHWPGMRTDGLHNIDDKFFNYFCNKLFSLYFDLNTTNIKWNVETAFQIIPKLHSDKSSAKNTGWIHTDDGYIFAGIIYLNPNPNPDAGTSLYKLINPNNIDSSSAKIDLYKNNIDTDYDNSINKHNQSFQETARFNNVYNRLISFDSTVYHGANSFYSESENRLTQVFFVKQITSNQNVPIQRSKNVIFNRK